MKTCIRSLKNTYMKSLTLWVKPLLPLGQNLLEMLEKYSNEPCVFFIKVDQIFLKGQYGSTHIVPDSNFSKDA